MDRARVEELEALHQAVTQGSEWEAASNVVRTSYGLGSAEHRGLYVASGHSPAEAALIAAAVNALPALLRLARAVAEAERWYVDYRSAHRVDLDDYDNGGQTVILLRADAAGSEAGEKS